tara:strand:+ start:4275 stop:4865 length:591 start_codon:yes stop_codon:yes gene_type:complete
MIIGICGLIGSGKGTVADILVENHNFEKLSFADKLKDGVASVFGWDRDMLEGDTDRSRIWREKPDVFWSNETGSEVTPRLVLQLFGTDCMRNGFFDGIWVSLVKQKILENPDKNWVIPDVRFPNEVKMIQGVQGQVWQVRRGELPNWFLEKRDNNKEPSDVHASEWAWIDKDSEFNQIIQNDGSLEELLMKLKTMV